MVGISEVGSSVGLVGRVSLVGFGGRVGNSVVIGGIGVGVNTSGLNEQTGSHKLADLMATFNIAKHEYSISPKHIFKRRYIVISIGGLQMEHFKYITMF